MQARDTIDAEGSSSPAAGCEQLSSSPARADTVAVSASVQTLGRPRIPGGTQMLSMPSNKVEVI